MLGKAFALALQRGAYRVGLKQPLQAAILHNLLSTEIRSHSAQLETLAAKLEGQFTEAQDYLRSIHPSADAAYLEREPGERIGLGHFRQRYMSSALPHVLEALDAWKAAKGAIEPPASDAKADKELKARLLRLHIAAAELMAARDFIQRELNSESGNMGDFYADLDEVLVTLGQPPDPPGIRLLTRFQDLTSHNAVPEGVPKAPQQQS